MPKREVEFQRFDVKSHKLIMNWFQIHEIFFKRTKKIGLMFVFTMIHGIFYLHTYVRISLTHLLFDGKVVMSFKTLRISIYKMLLSLTFHEIVAPLSLRCRIIDFTKNYWNFKNSAQNCNVSLFSWYRFCFICKVLRLHVDRKKVCSLSIKQKW